MKSYFRRHPLVQRTLFVFFIAVIFLLGRYIPLPHVALGAYLAEEDSVLNMGASISGGSLSQIGLFSLGVGPWMYAMILLRLFSIGKKSRPVSKERQNFRQNLLMLTISLIQGLSLAVNLTYTGGYSWMYVFQATLMLIAGAYVLYWLGNQNAEYGFGGPTIIIIMNMFLGQKISIDILADLLSNGEWAFPLFLGIWILLMLYINIVFEKAEYRIPVNRISINNDLAEDAYMPIKLSVSGGQPFMYAFSFLMFPQYIIMLLRYFYPNATDWNRWSTYFTMTSLPGVCIYAVIIFLLCISFAFVNVDPRTQAEGMRNSGDYINGVRPGRETQLFFRNIIWQVAVFYGIYLVVVVTLPMFIALGDLDLMRLAGLSGLFLMVSGMIQGVLSEINVARLADDYKSLFK